MSKLRAPVICVLGHVDAGKTSLLDKLSSEARPTHEAGGITQQIGISVLPIQKIKDRCNHINDFKSERIPGFLLIDTPGHEAFANMRGRGATMCDIAILVVDILHGLQPQTIEAINILKHTRTPFIIALNKIDRMFGWEPDKSKDVRDLIKEQSRVKAEFKDHVKQVIASIAEQGLNAALFYESPDLKTYVSMVPLSAQTGDGIANMISLLVHLSEHMLTKQLRVTPEPKMVITEVTTSPGVGRVVDVLLTNGVLKHGDRIITCGHNGPVDTSIRIILTKRGRSWVDTKEANAPQVVRIATHDMDGVIPGICNVMSHDQTEVQLHDGVVTKSVIEYDNKGVFVQASTLGSLETMVTFLKQSGIPCMGGGIGPVMRKDILKVSTTEDQYMVVLAFNVKVDKEMMRLATRMDVKIFQSDVMYQLLNRFIGHRDAFMKQKRDELADVAVFPCKLRVLQDHVYKTRDPIIMGVTVEAGLLKEGTPLAIPSKGIEVLGVCKGIQFNHKTVDIAKKGDEVCIKIEAVPGSVKMYGRHFDHQDVIMSKITREGIDVCKQYFRDDLKRDDWMLMRELKNVFGIL